MYHRNFDGSLSLVNSYPTGGVGSYFTAPDPLGSQNSLLLTPDGKWLLAVNAGKNEPDGSGSISVFQVQSNGLKLVDQVSSGGIMPVSLTIFGNEVFVLNDMTPNITGFTLSNKGDLDPIWHSTRSLPTTGNFGQVGFDNSGNWLVVTDKVDSNILVYSMGWNQLPAENPVITPSSLNTPFSFIFDNHDNLLVVDVNATPPTFNGAVSSYRIDRDGALATIGTTFNGQAASCWITSNEMGYIFTTNPGPGSPFIPSISSFIEKDSSGKVNLVNATASTGIPVIDEGTTSNGQFLYAVGPGAGIYGWMIGHDGSLTVLNGGVAFPGLSGSPYIQGIAVQ
jgi:hypothetical protein